MHAAHKGLLWGSLLVLVAGCAHRCGELADGLAARIEAPPALLPAPVQRPTFGTPVAAQEAGPAPAHPTSPLPEVAPVEPETCQHLTLPGAIELAFRLQPRLRVYVEGIAQAQGTADIAFAPFLPAAFASYSAGGFDVTANGLNVAPGQLPGFTFIPALGAVPFGLNINTGYEVADLKLQWLLCDFGRRLGRYYQAELAVDIARLQTDRAYQTVANEVGLAYLHVLRTRALRKTAEEAVRRAEADLQVARGFAKGGVLEREKVLRAEVQLAQTQRALDQTESAEQIAVAGLNLAIGQNINTPLELVSTDEIPSLPPDLGACLQTAATTRRELAVARRSIDVVQEGKRVARADFAPRIVAEGSLLDFQQSSPRAHLDLALGFIKLEWGLFEGGKRVGEMRVADAKLRIAVAQAETVADTISFQVTEAYRQLITAHKGIDRARPTVEQATETHRLVLARYRLGDATSTDVIEAETSLTRAQQDYLNSIYDYHSALIRLQFAMGVTPLI